MITKMKRLTFLIHNREYDRFLEQLRSIGVVHVVQKQQGLIQDKALQQDVALLQRCKSALKELQATAVAEVIVAVNANDYSSASSVLDALDAIHERKAALEQRIQALERDRAQLLPWGNFEPEQVSRLTEAGYTMRFYTCPLRAFREEWYKEYGVVEVVRDKQKVNFVTLTHNDVVPQIDAEQVQLPSVSLGATEQNIATANQELTAIPSRMAALASAGTELLRECLLELENRVSFQKVRLNGQPTAADSLLLLEGWAPALQIEHINSELNLKGVMFIIEDPTPDDDIPIQLNNNKFARLFEPLTRLYMLPTYQELDLTLFFAPFFMLFFGLCLGDIGYGLLMIVALPIFTKLFQLINPNFSKWLVVLFGASTMLCGLLSGSFFGFCLYDIQIPFVQSIKNLLYTDNSTMFTVSLCIGVVQILFGMGIKAVNLTIQCGFKYSLSTIGWLLLLITVGVGVLTGADMKSPLIMTLLIVAGVLIFLLNSPGKNPLLNIGLGLWDSYNMATGLLGDVLSYVRLFALGLSGGILANVFNSMAVGMKPDNPVAGFIVMVLIFAIGHALNIFMNILGAIVHPMRLTFVEFFKNAGYTGGGTEYTPFESKTELAE